MLISRNNKDNTKSQMFLDESGGVSIARYDKLKYPFFDKVTTDMVSLFWIPEEIDLSKDRRDFNNLTENEKHIFVSNLKRQIVLDTVQGKAPALLFLPIASIPELEPAIDTLQFQESIHSRSYTHIIRNVFNDPSEVFDGILDMPEIQDLMGGISEHYDRLWRYNCMRELDHPDYDLMEHKKAIYLALVTWNALEAIRFYVSFTCSWAFAEVGKMIGNATIIKLIARDEERHALMSSRIINNLVKDDPDFVEIRQKYEGEATQIYHDVAEQECEWADFLFKDGSMIGLDSRTLKDFIMWRTKLRMKYIGLTPLETDVSSNPVPWISQWLSSSAVQEAPQETEVSSYLIGIINPDMGNKDLSKLLDFKNMLKKA